MPRSESHALHPVHRALIDRLVVTAAKSGGSLGVDEVAEAVDGLTGELVDATGDVPALDPGTFYDALSGRITITNDVEPRELEDAFDVAEWNLERARIDGQLEWCPTDRILPPDVAELGPLSPEEDESLACEYAIAEGTRRGLTELAASIGEEIADLNGKRQAAISEFLRDMDDPGRMGDQFAYADRRGDLRKLISEIDDLRARRSATNDEADQAAREALRIEVRFLKQNYRLILAWANRLHAARSHPDLDWFELVQEAKAGATLAFRGFDPSKGHSLRTWVSWYILHFANQDRYRHSRTNAW